MAARPHQAYLEIVADVHPLTQHVKAITPPQHFITAVAQNKNVASGAPCDLKISLEMALAIVARSHSIVKIYMLKHAHWVFKLLWFDLQYCTQCWPAWNVDDCFQRACWTLFQKDFQPPFQGCWHSLWPTRSRYWVGGGGGGRNLEWDLRANIDHWTNYNVCHICDLDFRCLILCSQVQKVHSLNFLKRTVQYIVRWCSDNN